VAGIEDHESASLSLDDLHALIETGRELSAEVSLRGLLERILDRASDLTGSPDSSIILHDPRRDVLYFAHARGGSADEVLARFGQGGPETVPVEGSKAGQVFTTGEPIVVQSVARDPNHFKGVDRTTTAHTSSMICVPLAVGGTRIGVVQLLNKPGPYDRRDLLVLEHFASQAAVAVRNARLFEELLAHMGLYASQDELSGPLEYLEELNRPAHLERLSILFADMRGSTRLSDLIGRPDEFQGMMSDFLGMLADAVIAERGIVSKFLGDGLLALFRGEGHEERAVRSAFAMVEGFRPMRERWDAGSNAPLDFLDVGVGIATDSVILGCMGSERLKDFTAVGIAVNMAEHLVRHARDGRRVLVDKLTFRAVEGLLSGFDGPEAAELRKPGQAPGRVFESYHLQGLAGAAAAPSPAAPAAPAPPAPAPAATDAPVFVSYAHRDAAWLDELRTHLKPYLRAGSVQTWDDRAIRAGDRWRDQIAAALESARAAVLLVSPYFLDSEFIASKELPRLLDDAAGRGLRILWVPVSASSFGETEIAEYQATIDPARPIDMMTPAERNVAWVGICRQIKAALEG
jgi:class 3 adenylate cyclase